MLDFLLLPTSKTYWHDHVQAPNPQTPSFLDSPPNTSTSACIFFKLQWQQLEWSSRCRKIFSLNTLSLCEGNLLKDLTRDSHKPQYEQHRLLRAFAYKTLNTQGGTRGTLISLSLQSQKRGLGFPLYNGRN